MALCKTMVSRVNPGPNPSKTPHSNPSPVVPFPSVTDFLLISSSTNSTHALDMFPYSLKTFLEAFSLLGFNLTFSSIWFKIAGPPGCTTQNNEFQSLTPITAFKLSSNIFSTLSPINIGTLMECQSHLAQVYLHGTLRVR
ncbi:hypothetical protein VIGAN_05008900 [Vigna angularis var. angularis]|uniref:Uncharacterized protein n=1 Tax=Vigna angularis var. angularis TaxID=157739 RepID=A0A0S3S1Q4_PHAAN|nr:hypothetical protein VIGAN_05008900 [Vigna angularis var. angularis]